MYRQLDVYETTVKDELATVRKHALTRHTVALASGRPSSSSSLGAHGRGVHGSGPATSTSPSPPSSSSARDHVGTSGVGAGSRNQERDDGDRDRARARDRHSELFSPAHHRLAAGAPDRDRYASPRTRSSRERPATSTSSSTITSPVRRTGTGSTSHRPASQPSAQLSSPIAAAPTQSRPLYGRAPTSTSTSDWPSDAPLSLGDFRSQQTARRASPHAEVAGGGGGHGRLLWGEWDRQGPSPREGGSSLSREDLRMAKRILVGRDI